MVGERYLVAKVRSWSHRVTGMSSERQVKSVHRKTKVSRGRLVPPWVGRT